jgi:cobalt-zinc-cadmium efflux system outer membrane protein
MIKQAVIMPSLLALAATLAGCGTVALDESFDTVRETAAMRAGAETAWPLTDEAKEEIHERVATLLAEPIDQDRAVAIALLNNRRLRAEYARLGLAQADFVEAGLLENPTIIAAAGFPDRPPSLTQLDFGLTLNVLRVLLMPARKEIAQLGLNATTLEVADLVLETAAETRVVFLDLQAAQHTSDMLREIAAAAGASAEFARRLHAAGNLSDLALANQESLSEQSRVEFARSLVEVAERRELLNVQLGLWGDQTGWAFDDRLAELPPSELDMSELESLAVRQRLDLAAAALNVEAIAKAGGLQRDWRYLLTTEVGGFASRDTDGQWVYGPEIALELPIFDQRQGQIARFDAQLLGAESQLEGLAIKVRSDVRRLRDRLYAIRYEAEHYRDVIVPLRERITRLTQEQYNFMLVDTFDLLGAKRDEIAAYRAYLDDLHDYWTTRAELERVVGGRLPGPDASPAEEPPSVRETPPTTHEHGAH